MATAAPATRWLLVEQPGAWGRNALGQSDLAADVAVELLKKTTGLGARVQLIRRPPDRALPGRSRRWAYVDCAAQQPLTAWWGEFDDDHELLDLALDGSQGDPSTAPIFLVCTHTRHDACCALFGRPAYSELAQVYPDNTWETSHVGGDRFAANMVILPTGLYYGGLEGDSAIHVAASHVAGRIELSHFRGSSVHAAPTQAAEHYLREYLGEYRISALVPLDLHQLDLARWVVRLAHIDGAQFEIEISSTHSAALHLLTCSAGHAAAARTFELIRLSAAATNA